MVITRKIEVFICEDDKDLRKSYYDKLYRNRDIAVKTANLGVSHLFILDNTTPYLSDDDRDKLVFLGCKGNKATKQNAPYVAASEKFKGQADMSMLSCVLQNVGKMYQDDKKKGMWNRSLRSYKSNMPIPFKASAYTKLRFADYTDKDGKTHNGCFFTLMGIPFQCKFGKDRSGNKIIMERIINGEYKMCTSSIQVDGKKIFLLLCVDIPKQSPKLDKGKALYAFLGVMNPIVCTTDIKQKGDIDTDWKTWSIGTDAEYNYRRRQIQEAVKRCQMNNRYNGGGHGRKKKCKAVNRYRDVERHYIDTKLHTYSRMLVDLAVKHKCGKIVLMGQEHREETAKEKNANGDNFILRNWSYSNLKTKIDYKAKMYGIEVKVEK